MGTFDKEIAGIPSAASAGRLPMRQEIRQCCCDLKETRTGLPCARFAFPAAFSGFGGHFPSEPILPGICMLQAAAVVLEDWHRAEVVVAGVPRARFLAPVRPDDVLIVECTNRRDLAVGMEAKIAISISSGAAASECVLHYRLGKAME